MRVLLAFPPPTMLNKQISFLPPIGILSLASFLESKGIQTDVLDCNVQNEKIEFEKFDVIGLSSNISNLNATLDIIKEIKETSPEKKVIVGGPQARCSPELFLENSEADAVIPGEGEHILWDYVRMKDKTKIKGIYLKRSGKALFTGDRPMIQTLDELPFPALQKVPLKKYKPLMNKRTPLSSIVTSRGCPYNCSFCMHQLGYRWRYRSPENVVDEIEWQVNDLGVGEIVVEDDNFTLDPKRTGAICDIISQRRIDVKFQLTNGIRVDRVDKELLIKLYDAGCWLLAVAPETGDKETLKRIGKGFSLDRVRLVLDWCEEIGIKTHTYFMLGFPWETEKHLRHTIDFALDINTNFVSFNRFIPFFGTKIYSENNFNNLDKVTQQHENYFSGGRSTKIEAEEFKKILGRAYRQIFLRPKMILKLLEVFNYWEFPKLFLNSIKREDVW
jgi:radical SAM superfamily enzyme YgiQ (UPF0313 family)